MKKKSFTLLLTALLSLSVMLAGCGSGNNGGGAAATEPGSSTAANGENQSAGSDKPTEITIMLPLNTSETPPDTIKTELEKLTNTKLTYQFFPADTYEEKLNTAFATGSLPQVTYLKNQTTFIQMKEAIKDGQFWEIGPYMSEFPNLNKLKPEILNNTKVDGKLYSLYIGRPLARQGIIYRKDWADKLGLNAPANVDELFEMAKAFTEQDPDGNGQKDTTGIVDRNELVYGTTGARRTVSSSRSSCSRSISIRWTFSKSFVTTVTSTRILRPRAKPMPSICSPAARPDFISAGPCRISIRSTRI